MMMKYRAIIKGVEYKFTLQELVVLLEIVRQQLIACVTKVTNSELAPVVEWLSKGNEPDAFTGLQDVNGVDIYSGDILQVKDFNVPSDYGVKEDICNVYFENGGAGWYLRGKEIVAFFSDLNGLYEFKVIGNIHVEVVE